MSNLVTQMMIADKYGPRLNIEQLAEVLDMRKGTIYNQLSAGTFAIKTYVDGGKRWADHRDVADHFESMRAMAV